MKKLNLTEQKGIAQIFLLIGMLLVAISLPLATKLVQQNQENRSNAATKTTCTCYKGNAQGAKSYGSYSSSSACKSACSGGSCKCTTSTVATTITTPICVYNCSNWSACSGGWKTCTAQTKSSSSPSTCTGGSKIGTRQACTSTGKTNGSTCNSNSECTSGYCSNKKCVAKPTTTAQCIYICAKWSDCVNGTKTCKEDKNATATACTGGTKQVGKTQSCSVTKKANGVACGSSSECNSGYCNSSKICANKPDTAVQATYYYFKEGTGCVIISATSITCQTIACYSSKSSCETAHRGPTPTIPASCGCYRGNAQGVNKLTQYTTADTCKAGGGTWVWSSSCRGTNTAASTYPCTYTYSDWSTCVGGTRTRNIASRAPAGCTGGSPVLSESCSETMCTVGTYKCEGKSIYYCKALAVGYSAWGVYKTCNVTCITSSNGVQCDSSTTLCGIAASDNRDHYPVSNHCITGATYVEVDKEGKDGYYNWTCTKGGVTNDCKAGTKKSGSGGGGGGGGSDYYTGFAVSPSTLKLKVGESATVTATESVIWSSDKADIAMVTADGIVTGVAVGTATVTATNASGATATVAVTVIASDARTLSFKVAFAGIKSYYTSGIGSTYNCLASLGDMTVEILNRPTNTYEKFTGVKVSVEGNELDSKENQVFRVSNLEVGSSLAGVNTFNYVKVKGPFHLKRRMCQDGQTGKLDETTTCDINLGKTDGVPYDFSEYTLLAGDVDSNGVINSVDFSLVKNAVNADAEPECGRQYDLNMDGVVNALDLNLVKDSLSSIDDE